MGAFLANPMIATAALPFMLGIALGLVMMAAAMRRPATELALWALALLLLYMETLGGPSFPPVSASQKLIYIAFAGLVVGVVAAFGLARHLLGFAAGAAVLTGFGWLGWRRLANSASDPAALVAIAAAILAAAGLAMLIARQPDARRGAHDPFVAPAAILSFCLAGAIISVLGASIVTGQFLGSVAALVGGWSLTSYILAASGRSLGSGWGRAITVLLGLAVVSAFLHTALLAPKANPVALLAAPLVYFMPALLDRSLATHFPASRVVRPLVAGVVVALPAILAILIAIVWAAEGAALGLS